MACRLCWWIFFCDNGFTHRYQASSSQCKHASACQDRNSWHDVTRFTLMLSFASPAFKYIQNFVTSPRFFTQTLLYKTFPNFIKLSRTQKFHALPLVPCRGSICTRCCVQKKELYKRSAAETLDLCVIVVVACLCMSLVSIKHCVEILIKILLNASPEPYPYLCVLLMFLCIVHSIATL